MADELSDESEEEMTNCKSVSARKKRLASSSSSDAEKSTTPAKDTNADISTYANRRSRSSERIRRRRSKSFTMPSKQEVWDAIPTTKTPEKSFESLKPRKLVNNFTRVTHRYNHDPAYTSDEGSSLDGFMVLDDESSSDSSDSDYFDEAALENETRKRRKKHRIKNRRIVQLSSGSDSEPTTSVPAESQGDNVRSRLREKILSRCSSVDENGAVQSVEKKSSTPINDLVVLGIKSAKALLASSSDEGKAKTDNVPSRNRRRGRDKRGRKRKLISSGFVPSERKEPSDADDEENTSASDKRLTVKSSLSDDVIFVEDGSKPGTSAGVGSDDTGDDDSDFVSISKRKKSVLQTDSECNDDSEKSDGESDYDASDGDAGDKEKELLSRSMVQSEEKRRKRKSLFKDLKEARSKKEANNKRK